MNADEKQRAIEHLRSVALQAHQAIDALRKDNFGNARDLVWDCQWDLEKAENLLPEKEGS